MFFLLEEAAKTSEPAETAERIAPVVDFVNQVFGPAVCEFEKLHTKPLWDSVLKPFGTNAEAVFGAYTPENAIPWYTVMFILACIFALVIVWILRGARLSEDEPANGQQVLEVAVLTIRNLLQDVVGPHGLKYFPVVATFAVLILVSNLMGLLPGLMSPTTSTSVTFALGITSFVYYNYIGIKENGLVGHLGHFAGVHYFTGAMLIFMGPVMFVIELISNGVRPLSLGLRLFGNIFGDEQVQANVAGLYPPWTYIGLPAVLLILGVFAAVMQTFIFILLSMIYIGEVSHAPHDDHGGDADSHDGHGELQAA
jgi:F-type H+-transporting ATPase subunit a